MARKRGLGPQGHAALQRAVEEDRKRYIARTTVKGSTSKPSPGPIANPAALQPEEPGEVLVEAELVWYPLGTSNPARPRCAEGAYDERTQELFVSFMRPTPGQDKYVYKGVDPSTADLFFAAESPGRFINAILNNHDYHRIN